MIMACPFGEVPCGRRYCRTRPRGPLVGEYPGLCVYL